MVKYICVKYKYIFSARGRLGVQNPYQNFRTTCCYLYTLRGGKFKFKLETAIVKYSGLI